MHYILHKPYGVISQFITNEKKRKNKKLLGSLGDFAEGTMAIGRLDEKSEGLLLLTTDGKMSAAVRQKSIEKEYYVELDDLITDEALAEMRKGVEIGFGGKRYTTLPCKAERLDPFPSACEARGSTGERDAFAPRPNQRERHRPSSWVSITITEGKYRQVRKMTAAVGYPTLRLIRVRIGNVLLGKLGPGEYSEAVSLPFKTHD